MSQVMWTVIIKNDSTSDVVITDLGITIPALDQLDFSSQEDYSRIAASDDLRDLVRNGTLVINNGIDLSPTSGVKYLTLRNLLDEYDTDPVEARVIAIQDSAPGTAQENDFYVNTTDDHLYKYVSSSWVDQGAIADGDRFINLDSTSQNIFEYAQAADLYDDLGQSENGAFGIVIDDGDSKPAGYVYLESSLSWVKVMDLDAFTLDECYDANSAGGGRLINATDKAVKIDTGSATNAPLELVPKSSLPTTDLQDGQIANRDGIVYVYDATRGKWLSIQRVVLVFGRKGTWGSAPDQFLNFCAGSLSSNQSGYRVVRNATIVSMSGQFDASGTGTFRVRKNDGATNIASLTVTAAVGGGEKTTNVDLTEGDFLQSVIEATPGVQDPMFIVEIAWTE